METSVKEISINGVSYIPKDSVVQEDMKDKKAKIYFDGSAQPNPGVCRCAIVIKDMEDKLIFEESYKISDEQTSNYGEYWGVVKGLEAAWRLGYRDIIVLGDSQLIVFQLSGKFKPCAHPNLKELYQKCKVLLSQFNSVDFKWIRREENERSDLLSR
jgi:ribonuclease HI